jgi:hypothetical protein
MPFMATDPSGMRMSADCIILRIDHGDLPSDENIFYNVDGTSGAIVSVNTTHYSYQVFCFGGYDGYGGGGGGDYGGGGEPGGGPTGTKNNRDPLCDKLKELGITNADFERMKSDYMATLRNELKPSSPGVIYREYGHIYSKGEYYPGLKIEGSPSKVKWEGANAGWEGTIVNPAVVFGYPTDMAKSKGYTFHTHTNLPGWISNENLPLIPGSISNEDFNNIAKIFSKMQHFMGWDGGLVNYGYDKKGNTFNETLAGLGWHLVNCNKKTN